MSSLHFKALLPLLTTKLGAQSWCLPEVSQVRAVQSGASHMQPAWRGPAPHEHCCTEQEVLIRALLCATVSIALEMELYLFRLWVPVARVLFKLSSMMDPYFFH